MLLGNRRKVRGGDISHFGFLPPVRFRVSWFRGYYCPWMLNTTVFLGYACNRLGTYFNWLVWIGALESCGTREWLVFSWHLQGWSMVGWFICICPSCERFSRRAKTVWFRDDSFHILFGTPRTTFRDTLHHLLKWTLIHQYVFMICFIITDVFVFLLHSLHTI